MTTTILQVIIGILGIVTLLIQEYYSKDAISSRKNEKVDDNVQEERKALQSGSVDAVCADQHDRVLGELGGSIGRRDNPN